MPVGTVVLIVTAVLIYFGVAQRVLDRMRLTDKTALIVLAALALGSLFNLRIIPPPHELSINVGGAIVPLLLSVYLIATADESRERTRGVLAAGLAGLIIFALTKTLVPEEQTMRVDPSYVFAAASAAIGYAVGRSRRAAFIGGSTGTLLSDLGHYIESWSLRIPSRTWLGGAGAFDSVILGGVLAVLLAEAFGEIRERLAAESEKPRSGEGE